MTSTVERWIFTIDSNAIVALDSQAIHQGFKVADTDKSKDYPGLFHFQLGNRVLHIHDRRIERAGIDGAILDVENRKLYIWSIRG